MEVSGIHAECELNGLYGEVLAAEPTRLSESRSVDER
ncbi:MAG: hypothetical protein ACJAYU_001791 [Bradymonadia bacterium]|jgi:hypothetical protein